MQVNPVIFGVYTGIPRKVSNDGAILPESSQATQLTGDSQPVLAFSTYTLGAFLDLTKKGVSQV